MWKRAGRKTYSGNFLLQNNQLVVNTFGKKTNEFMTIFKIFTIPRNDEWPIRLLQSFELVVLSSVSTILMWFFIALRLSVITLISTLPQNCTAAMEIFAAKLAPLIWLQCNNCTRSAKNKLYTKMCLKICLQALTSYPIQHENDFSCITSSPNPDRCCWKLIFQYQINFLQDRCKRIEEKNITRWIEYYSRKIAAKFNIGGNPVGDQTVHFGRVESVPTLAFCRVLFSGL